MESKVSVDGLVNIKQEYMTQNSVPNMSSCMYAQQIPVGNMTSNGAKSKMFRFHMLKENSKDLQMGHCRRRLDFNSGQSEFYGLKHGPTMSVARRNERERNRVKLINMTFATLREHLPYAPECSKSKKMSKVDTLKAAIEYIRYLQSLVDDHDAVSAVLSNNCVQFGLRAAMTTSTSSPQKSPTAASTTSESSFDGLGAEEEELLDFASWF